VSRRDDKAGSAKVSAAERPLCFEFARVGTTSAARAAVESAAYRLSPLQRVPPASLPQKYREAPDERVPGSGRVDGPDREGRD